MNKFLMGILACIVCMPSLFAQTQKTTMDLLTSSVWQRETDKNALKKYDKIAIMDFDLNDVENSVKKAIEYAFTKPYHLSDTLEEYNEKNVGKIKNGKYIITQGTEYSHEQFEARLDEVMRLMKEETGSSNMMGGRRTNKDQKERLQLLDEKFGKGTEVTFIYEIIKLTEQELILQRVSSETIIGRGPLKFHPYKGDIE